VISTATGDWAGLFLNPQKQKKASSGATEYKEDSNPCTSFEFSVDGVVILSKNICYEYFVRFLFCFCFFEFSVLPPGAMPLSSFSWLGPSGRNASGGGGGADPDFDDEARKIFSNLGVSGAGAALRDE
jgi:hypothetical protein